MNLSPVFKFSRKYIIFITIFLLISFAFFPTIYNRKLSSEVKAENLELIRVAQREQGVLAIIDFRDKLNYVWQGEEIAGYEFIGKEADMAVLTAEEDTYYLGEGEALPAAKSLNSTLSSEENSAGVSEEGNEPPNREKLTPGDRGADVVFLQHILYQNNYLDLVPNGNFAEQTESAVKSFQRYHGLNANGVVDDNTWEQLKQKDIPGFDAPESDEEERLKNDVREYDVDQNVLPEYRQISPREFDLLARIIHGESRGEPYRGKVAVGAVVINRVLSPQFPETITEVIYDKEQFSPVADGSYRLPPSETSQQAARESLTGEDPTQGALYFYNPDIASDDDWVEHKETLVRIGNHLFLQ